MKAVLFNTHDLALIFTVFICLLFSAFLITLKKGNKLSNYLLACFLLAQAAIPMDNLINFGEAFRGFALDISPNLFYTFGLAFWVEVPLLLLYIKSLVNKNYKLKKTDALYFIPFVLYATYFSFDWLALESASKLDALQNGDIATTPLLDRIIYFFRECFRFSISVLCYLELQKYQKNIKNEFAELESVDLTWLKVLVIGFLVVHINAIFVSIGIIMSYELGIVVDHELLGLTSNYAVLLLITSLIFFSAGNSRIFQGIDKELATNECKLPDSFEPEKINKIETYLVQNKPYLSHLLTLDNLASQLGIGARSLSSIINKHFGKNFFEFINYYRIEESKRLLILEENKSVTMLEIMDKAGFNSKATFNTFFKKLVGKTPTQFRKDHWEKLNAE
ncbi:helix-turn-helix domain-containing protein [Glaciecola sp. 2405UD65-10]|uniref:helix-turn-helix domain-containing protein n=1 Tax=Glaciecola sp. 2405UD65-10 TaxID=3397244 RepID=UPI003B5962B6